MFQFFEHIHPRTN